MTLLIDNYDSFSYNLYQLIGELNPDIKVIRNDGESSSRQPKSWGKISRCWVCAWDTRRSAQPLARRSPTPRP